MNISRFILSILGLMAVHIVGTEAQQDNGITLWLLATI
jgi:hypothetical protein